MKRVFVSGYFNPLTEGHLELFSAVRDSYEEYELWAIVNNDRQARVKSGYSFIEEKVRWAIIRAIRWIDRSRISQSPDESIAIDLDDFGRDGDVFVNSGDRDESNWNPKEVEICKRKGIQMVYLKLPKVNSSSKILDNYYKWRKSHECFTISEEAIRKYRESYRLDKLEKLEYNG